MQINSVVTSRTFGVGTIIEKRGLNFVVLFEMGEKVMRPDFLSDTGRQAAVTAAVAKKRTKKKPVEIDETDEAVPDVMPSEEAGEEAGEEYTPVEVNEEEEI